MSGDPFRALGLTASADLSDDDVRAAWRRVAAATHPDRADGGDPAAFAAAANAYSDLRTRFGRNEALADLSQHRARTGPGRTVGRWTSRARRRPESAPPAPRGVADVGGPRRAGSQAESEQPRADGTARRWLWRVRGGRPGRLALRIAVTVAGCGVAVAIAGLRPATLALAVGAFTWLIRGVRHDLAAPPTEPPRPA